MQWIYVQEKPLNPSHHFYCNFSSRRLNANVIEMHHITYTVTFALPRGCHAILSGFYCTRVCTLAQMSDLTVLIDR